MFLCSNKVKFISSIILIFVSLGAGGVGAYLYLLYLKDLTSYNVNGGDYLPEYNVNFSSFSTLVQYSAIGFGAVFVFSLITAMCKKPFFSFTFIIIAIAVGTYSIN
jgi:hypothetical protein